MILVILPNPDYFCQRPIGRRSAFRVTRSDDPDMEAVALAVAGQKRAELIAHHACVGPLLELARAEEARPHIERARAIVRELEAWRFEPANLAFLAEVEVEAGRPDRARPLLAEGLLLTRKTAMSCWGPTLLADSAWLAEDDDKRRAFVAEAEALLAGEVLAHNHYLARRALVELGPSSPIQT